MTTVRTPDVYRIRQFCSELRNTLIAQTKGTLFRIVASLEDDSRNVVGACCLGIGTKMVAEECGIKIEIRNDRLAFDGEEGGMPLAAQEFFGFYSSDPILVSSEDCPEYSREGLHFGVNEDGTRWSERYSPPGVSAATANDEVQLTFSQIADLFEWAYCFTPKPTVDHMTDDSADVEPPW